MASVLGAELAWTAVGELRRRFLGPSESSGSFCCSLLRFLLSQSPYKPLFGEGFSRKYCESFDRSFFLIFNLTISVSRPASLGRRSLTTRNEAADLDCGFAEPDVLFLDVNAVPL